MRPIDERFFRTPICYWSEINADTCHGDPRENELNKTSSPLVRSNISTSSYWRPTLSHRYDPLIALWPRYVVRTHAVAPKTRRRTIGMPASTDIDSEKKSARIAVGARSMARVGSGVGSHGRRILL